MQYDMPPGLYIPGITLKPKPSFTLSIKIAQKPYIIGSLGPKALKYESFDAKGYLKPDQSPGQASEFLLTLLLDGLKTEV